MDSKRIKNAVIKNLTWFKNSGVMLPDDGSWGVAERIATSDNGALERIFQEFPACRQYNDYYLIEQRRADCCFEAAWLFLEAGRFNPEYRQIGENIMEFLYCRSGLLNRYDKRNPIGSWNWSHIKWEPVVYFDDNAWCVFIQLLIARKYPELDKKYDCTKWALCLAEELYTASHRSFDTLENDPLCRDPEEIWRGTYALPHWGSLSAMALAAADEVKSDSRYKEEIRRYHEYVARKAEELISSEQAYALLGCCYCAKVLNDPFYLELSQWLGNLLGSKVNLSSGNLAAEHYESPNGSHLVDTIYTLNWSAMAFQALADLTSDPEHIHFKDIILNLLLSIQDNSNSVGFNGCWRGMYDLQSQCWGGGDCFEGGCGSIYTGWTNAIIGLTLLFENNNKSFIS